ncbi:MAG: hypothetical protein Q8Q04_00635 [archaeon]|nr:hypothetical protein [archaeon]
MNSNQNNPKFRTTIYLTEYERELISKSGLNNKFSEWVRQKIKEEFGEFILEEKEQETLRDIEITKREILNEETKLKQLQEQLDKIIKKNEQNEEQRKILYEFNLNEKEAQFFEKVHMLYGTSKFNAFEDFKTNFRKIDFEDFLKILKKIEKNK